MARQGQRDLDPGTTREACSSVAFGSCGFGAYELDAGRRLLTRSGATLRVQAKPLDLLLYLSAHRERVVSHSELLDALWPQVHVSPAALARAVYKARRAVGDAKLPRRVIATVHGRGFRFVAPLRSAGAPKRRAASPGDSIAREVELARCALERAVLVLGDLDAIDAPTLSFLRSLARELCRLFVSILGARRTLEHGVRG
jgi:DNA-binding winged helix-turn-helix (wHTH) protein